MTAFSRRVLQMRLIGEADDFKQAVRFYRARHATLEISARSRWK